MTPATAAPTQTVPDSARQRLQAFCSPAAPEVFHSIVQPAQIWQADPFDVETIHEPARQMFERLLQRAANSEDTALDPTAMLLTESQFSLPR